MKRFNLQDLNNDFFMWVIIGETARKVTKSNYDYEIFIFRISSQY